MSNSVKKKPAIAVCNFTNYFRSSKHWGGSKEDFSNLMLADAKIKKKVIEGSNMFSDICDNVWNE